MIRFLVMGLAVLSLFAATTFAHESRPQSARTMAAIVDDLELLLDQISNADDAQERNRLVEGYRLKFREMLTTMPLVAYGGDDKFDRNPTERLLPNERDFGVEGGRRKYIPESHLRLQFTRMQRHQETMEEYAAQIVHLLEQLVQMQRPTSSSE